MIPVIETERLRLRGPKPADAPSFDAFYAVKRSQYVGGDAGHGRGWRVLAMQIGQWQMLGVGSWVVTAADTDEAIGLVGAWCPSNWPEQEIGWSMFDGAEGKGFAFEAAQAARRALFHDFGWTTAVSYINPANARSIRLAERLGCTLDTTAARPDPDDLVYRHPVMEAPA